MSKLHKTTANVHFCTVLFHLMVVILTVWGVMKYLENLINTTELVPKKLTYTKSLPWSPLGDHTIPVICRTDFVL